VVADALDPAAVLLAIENAAPEVVIHELTSIPARPNIRKFDREFALTNRLRTEGTDNLLAAARAAGVRRVVAQSYGAWPYARQGGSVKTEQDPLDPDPPAALGDRSRCDPPTSSPQSWDRPAWQGIILRYGAFYGPEHRSDKAALSSKKSAGAGFRSSETAKGLGPSSTSTMRHKPLWAADRTRRAGIYNIVDDDPAPSVGMVAELASAMGAPPPRHVPAFVAGWPWANMACYVMTKFAEPQTRRQSVSWIGNPSGRAGGKGFGRASRM